MPPIPGRQPMRNGPRGLGAILKSQPVEDWRRINVGITIEDPETGRRHGVGTIVDALGELAVHRGVGTGDQSGKDYRVSHIPTGLLVARVATDRDAKLIASYLHHNAPEIFSQESQQDVKELLPSWVRTWVLACREARGYVDPSPYREGR